MQYPHRKTCKETPSPDANTVTVEQSAVQRHAEKLKPASSSASQPFGLPSRTPMHLSAAAAIHGR